MQYINRLVGGVLGFWLVILVATGIYGYFSTFVPSPLMVTVTIWTASLLGLVNAAFYCGIGDFGWRPGLQPQATGTSSLRNSKLPENRFLRGLVTGVAMFGLTWMSLASGPGLLLTQLLGHRGEMSATVAGWAPRSGRSCSHPTLSYVPPLIMNEHTLCTNDRALPKGTLIRIIGRESPLGVIAETFQSSP